MTKGSYNRSPKEEQDFMASQKVGSNHSSFTFPVKSSGCTTWDLYLRYWLRCIVNVWWQRDSRMLIKSLKMSKAKRLGKRSIFFVLETLHQILLLSRCLRIISKRSELIFLWTCKASIWDFNSSETLFGGRKKLNLSIPTRWNFSGKRS